MDNDERYSIYCNYDEQNVYLIPTEDEDTFRCPICNNTYTGEDGVMDILLAQDYGALYKGAVRAGFIPDPDFAEYDKEHRNDRY